MSWRRGFGVVSLTAAAVCCGGKSSVQPTPFVESPVIACPSDLEVLGHHGQQPTVSFDIPIPENGYPPVGVVCTPGSDEPFPNGITIVTCEATDARDRKGTCNFSVTVTPVPQIAKTTFLAFGDSITEGKVRLTTLVGRGIVVVGPCPISPTNPSGICFNNGPSYVEQLNAKMTARYQDQTITIVAEGLGDEEAGQGKLRLPPLLSLYNPDALLLLEGTNDLLHTTDPAKLPGAAASIVEALRTMVVTARGRGIKVYVATLPPLDPARQSQAPEVPIVNAMIATMAAQEGATLVDMYTAITPDLLGSDGIHLKPEGYDAMADAWLKAIMETLEIPPTMLR